MDWKTLIAEIQATGMSQTQIGERIGKSQAWVSAAANGLYGDLKWSDGEAVCRLHDSVVSPASSGANEQAA